MDLYHAREHLHDLGKLLAFMLGDQHATWVAGRSGELDDGDIEALLSAARAFPLTGAKAEELGTALGYFETNAPRMRYKHFRSLRPVRRLLHRPRPAARRSSGSASNSPACARHCDGATGILTLRCQQARQRLGKNLAAAAQPARSGLTRYLTTTRTQTIQARPGYRSVTYILVPHPTEP